ncbi:uncharacterized protein LOC113799449 isoform X1 [Dermatophagoides pteronyssinus]|uniref:uncharacterized protein LOC113799449 isoform X1 n=1 Tax=Dermatophagoides pteronyssinus TaxID=6956 RepID=UPI003F66166E
MQDSPLQLLIKTYCLFTFVCFEQPQLPLEQCPKFCQCFTAPLVDDGEAHLTNSLVCTKSEAILDEKFPNKQYPILNSLIINVKNDGKDDLQSTKFSKNIPIISVNHLTLQGFTGRLTDRKTPTIFNWFDTSEIKSLSFIEWSNNEVFNDPVAFNFAIMQKFSQLQILRFESCFLQIIDQNFNSVQLEKLHTLIIKQSKLNYIHRNAFNGKAKQFRRIILSNNQLTNLKWITSSLSEQFESLWQLDLSNNCLRILPKKLVEKLPNLNVLYIYGNNFKFFQYESLIPWFKIQEFRLSHTTANDIIYLNDQMKWIDKFPSIFKQIDSMFTMESFLKFYQYCHDNDGLIKMDYLWNNFGSLHYRKYIPDKLIIQNGNDHGQLVINHCDTKEQSAQINEPIFLIGLEVSDILIRQEIPFFKILSSLGDSMPPTQVVPKTKHAIKLFLMDKDMWNFWMNGQRKRTNNDIILWIDIVEELLDLAYTKNQYIMLTFWSHKEFSNLAMPSDLLNAENFKQTIIKPLIEKIHDHPSLMGIEIVDNAFQTQLSNSKQNIDPNILRNNCPYNDEFLRKIQNEIEFIAYHVGMLKEYLNEPLIGIGMDSNCKPCLPLLLIDDCLSDQSSTINSGSNFDFITIRSLFSETNTIYGYKELEKNFNNWFLQHEKMNSINKKHLFYSIYGNYVKLDQNVVKQLEKFTMGYFTPSDHRSLAKIFAEKNETNINKTTAKSS